MSGGVVVGIQYTGDTVDVIGADQLDRLEHVAANIFRTMLERHLIYAMSGAMRWPSGMRPEVMIGCNSETF